jgi:hypothetical protein
VINGDKPLAPSSSPLSRPFAPICHNLYYVFMTAAEPDAIGAVGRASICLKSFTE